jgi:flagellar hook protein FlgE
MYSGITGLNAHGEKLNVIGNNIANVNTIGYKGSRMQFEDVMSQDIFTSAGIAQMGQGVQVGSLYSNFAQGAFETSSENTDMAIGGEGFFTLKVKGEDQTYYTRAGNFRFDNDGYLTDPHGYVVQGWEVESETDVPASEATTSAEAATNVRITGSPTDIQLSNFQSDPNATNKVTLINNLDSTQTSKTNDPDDPFFALAKTWDGTESTPLPSEAYAYSNTIKTYDANGSSHTMTVYYDQVALGSNAGGKKVWEYVVTVNPNDDGRIINDVRLNTTSGAGMLMMGTLTFNAGGDLSTMTSYTLESNASITSNNTKNLSNWTLADFSADGYPITTANFLLESNASLPGAENADNIKIDFGLRNSEATGGASDSGWAIYAGGTYSSYSNASQIGSNVSSAVRLPSFADTDVNAMASTSYASSSSTLFQSQDGYTAGFLQNTSVDRDGVLTGRYSNGQILDLYVITLADFNNKWGLRREGGNLFSETRESGSATTNRPNVAGKGSIAGNTLETSNVDLSDEFVKMITTEKGFQANTKVITTTDTLLSSVIAMKR